jgi:rare lipoprotein A (peptidoglycan hydrolase)
VAEGWRETRASWYGYPPVACYDRGRRTPFPTGEKVWTAHKTLPCGTVLEVEHAGRTIRVPVMDRGPYCECGNRELDLSAEAFRQVVGPLSKGVGVVRWRVVPN